MNSKPADSTGAEAFEQLIRDELTTRDKRRRARLLHPDTQAEADELLIQAITKAAGHKPSADSSKRLRTAQHHQRTDHRIAFGS